MLKADLEKALGGPVEERADLSRRTSIRAGGTAELFATVASEEALARAIEVCAARGAAWHVLGLGSNTLVSDAGFRGVVLKLAPALAPEEIGEAGGGRVRFKIGAGQALARLVHKARERRCVGMEFLGGIPGTIGGAVVMNAGTKGGSTGQICAEVGLVEAGRARTLPAEEIGFGYRTSRLPAGAVITWARFLLTPGDADALARSRQALDDDLAYRKRTQPYDLPSFGSTFKNPPGDHAARLIDACGLKGRAHGGAQISELHANFIVNRGGATAADVLALMGAMFGEVRARFGVQLAPEVKLLGEFDPAELPWSAPGPEKTAA